MDGKQKLTVGEPQLCEKQSVRNILYSESHEGLHSSKSGGTADRSIKNPVRPEPEVQGELLRLNIKYQ